jgi:hypothetical protein
MGRHKFLNEELAADNDPDEVDEVRSTTRWSVGVDRVDKMRPLISYLTSNHEYTIPVMTTTAISVFLLFSSSPSVPYRNTHTHTLRAKYEQQADVPCTHTRINKNKNATQSLTNGSH